MLRGLEFLERYGQSDTCWKRCAPDVVYMFFHLSTRPVQGELTRRARLLSMKTARRWMRENRRLPESTLPEEALWWHAYGAATAKSVGLDTRPLVKDLTRAVTPRWPRLIFGFDPRRQPPPSRMAWQNALVGAHIAEGAGVPFPSSVRDAVQWRDAMLPYPRPRRSLSWPGWCAFYAVTHLVYVLNDYNRHTLSPRGLEAEVAFVREACRVGLEQDDVEALGEAVDVLLALGTPENDPLVMQAQRAMLLLQNRGGSWGDREDEPYTRFHKTWVALDGLTRYGARRTVRARIPRAPARIVRA